MNGCIKIRGKRKRYKFNNIKYFETKVHQNRELRSHNINISSYIEPPEVSTFLNEIFIHLGSVCFLETRMRVCIRKLSHPPKKSIPQIARNSLHVRIIADSIYIFIQEKKQMLFIWVIYAVSSDRINHQTPVVHQVRQTDIVLIFRVFSEEYVLHQPKHCVVVFFTSLLFCCSNCDNLIDAARIFPQRGTI